MKAHRSNDRNTGHTIDVLTAEAVSAMINGTEWLAANEVARRHKPEEIDPLAVTNMWKEEARIFSIELAGQTLYPLYLFDETGKPISEVAEILDVFAGYQPFRIASWFESTNSMLRGKRPREVLASDPAVVLAAAKDHKVGAVHG
jgi:hypothetical protein